ncbi:MAG: holo-ACP synthase [Fibrobacterales bacterium]
MTFKDGCKVLGVGIDISSIARVEKSGDKTIEKILTLPEREYCGDGPKKWERTAGRFSAKEAILKALGTGWAEGIQWSDIEILPDEKGAPQAVLTGKAQEIATLKGGTEVLVSISHDAGMATAIALLQ